MLDSQIEKVEKDLFSEKKDNLKKMDNFDSKNSHLATEKIPFEN